jgi:hypothetical protein
MLYIAFFKIEPHLSVGSSEIIEMSRKWVG